MKKEIFLSIAIGFGIGLAVTFGVYWARKSFQSSPEIRSPLPSDYTPPSQININSNPQNLSLISPIDQSLIKEAKTLVSGTTTPLAWVVILTENKEKVIQADEKGHFETEINLIAGENEIEVNSFTENGHRSTQTITVVYSTAEI